MSFKILHEEIKYALVELSWRRIAVHRFHRDFGFRESKEVSGSEYEDPYEDLTFTSKAQYQEAH